MLNQLQRLFEFWRLLRQGTRLSLCVSRCFQFLSNGEELRGGLRWCLGLSKDYPHFLSFREFFERLPSFIHFWLPSYLHHPYLLLSNPLIDSLSVFGSSAHPLFGSAILPERASVLQSWLPFVHACSCLVLTT